MSTLGWLGDLLGLNSGDPAIDAANKNRTALDQFGTTGSGILDTGTAGAQAQLGKTSALTDLGPGANGLLGDALGTGGADGTARALAAFQTDPGYQFQMDQGQQALDRTAAARGQFQSGETGLDTLRFSQGLADQGWQKWLQNLMGGIQGETASNTALANLDTGAAGQKVGFLGDILTGQLGANNQQASGESANKQGLSSLFGNVLGIAKGFSGFGGFGGNPNPTGL
jgi:hypothetical protein